jgi:hypothetical protein
MTMNFRKNEAIEFSYVGFYERADRLLLEDLCGQQVWLELHWKSLQMLYYVSDVTNKVVMVASCSHLKIFFSNTIESARCTDTWAL